MKFLATVLVLAFVSASKAQEQFSDLPPINWEDAVDKFWAFTDKVSLLTKEAAPREALDTELRDLISDALTQLNESSQQLQSRLGPYSAQFQSDIELLGERLQRDLNSVQGALQVYNEEVGMMVRQNLGDIRHSLSMYLRKYRKRVSRDREEIRRKFAEYQTTLEEQGRRAVVGLREAVEPVAQEVGGKLKERFTAIQEDLHRRMSHIQQQARELHERTAVDGQGLREAIEAKMETIQRWFETESQKISRRFQEWIDSVREQRVEDN